MGHHEGHGYSKGFFGDVAQNAHRGKTHTKTNKPYHPSNARPVTWSIEAMHQGDERLAGFFGGHPNILSSK